MNYSNKNHFDLLNTKDRIIVFLFFIFWFGIFVVPNSFREVKIPLFVLITLLAAFSNINFDRRLIKLWFLGSCVTIVYLLIGDTNAYPNAFWQVLFVYVVSPLFWIIVCRFIVLKVGMNLFMKYLIAFGVIGAMTVPMFYYYFLTHGADSLTWMIAVPNVQYGDGSAGATMNVFGPLMFIVAGCLSVPQVIENRLLRLSTVIVLVLAVLLSGRAALFLAMATGLCFFIYFFLLTNRMKFSSLVGYIIGGACVVFIIVNLSNIFIFDSSKIVNEVISKFSESGGVERIQEQNALEQGILNNYFLGSGHGVGVEVIRNDNYPWRYELLWLATLYRVGIIGTFIYSLPFLVVIISYLSFRKIEVPLRTRNYNNFMFAGFIACLIGSYTNPYYESFEFQWMIILPLVYFLNVRHLIKHSHSTDLSFCSDPVARRIINAG